MFLQTPDAAETGHVGTCDGGRSLTERCTLSERSDKGTTRWAMSSMRAFGLPNQ